MKAIVVTAALLIDNGRILIARRPAGDKLAFKWEFPGGKLESGETLEECLFREMKEEFDIEIQVGSFFAESCYEYERGAIRLMVFWARLIKGELKPTAHDKIMWITSKELANYDFAPADVPLVEKLMGLNDALKFNF